MFRIVVVCLWSVLPLCASDTDWQTEVQHVNGSLEAVASTALASPDIRDKAWGAHLIAKHHLQALRPALLLEMVNEVADAAQRYAWLAQCSDALIATDGTVEPSIPVILESGGMQACAVYLASFEPEKHREFLLKTFHDEARNFIAWQAAANLLASGMSNGVTSLLETYLGAAPGELEKKVESFRITCNIELKTAGELQDANIRSNTRVYKVKQIDDMMHRLPGWPPLVYVSLVLGVDPRLSSKAGVPGDRLVASGPSQVYVHIKHSDDSINVSDLVSNINKQGYVSVLLLKHREFSHKPAETIYLEGSARDAGAFQQAVARQMTPLADEWSRFISGLVSLAGIPPKFETWRPPVTILVTDLRSDHSWELPVPVLPGFGGVDVKLATIPVPNVPSTDAIGPISLDPTDF